MYVIMALMEVRVSVVCLSLLDQNAINASQITSDGQLAATFIVSMVTEREKTRTFVRAIMMQILVTGMEQVVIAVCLAGGCHPVPCVMMHM